MKTWEEFLRAGGNWLGSARAWMQRKKINGSRVTWGSMEALEPPMLVREVEDVAANASWAAYKTGYEEGKKFSDLQIRLWQEYAAFLGVEIGNLAMFAATHGWQCPEATVFKGRELREKLGVDDNWQLIEKRNDEGFTKADTGLLCGAYLKTTTNGVSDRCQKNSGHGDECSKLRGWPSR